MIEPERAASCTECAPRTYMRTKDAPSSSTVSRFACGNQQSPFPALTQLQALLHGIPARAGAFFGVMFSCDIQRSAHELPGKTAANRASKPLLVVIFVTAPTLPVTVLLIMLRAKFESTHRSRFQMGVLFHE